MSLAKRRWRLRQMAWSLQHSGVARLVLKSSSLTFQQILPGGWGVCHTTPRIHMAPFTPPTPLLLPSYPPIPSTPPQHGPLTTLYRIPAILSSHMYRACSHLDACRGGSCGLVRWEALGGGGGGGEQQIWRDSVRLLSWKKEPKRLNWERWPLLSLQCKKKEENLIE